MIIEELLVSEFRNLQRIDSTFGPGIHLIYGRNGQGKTNLLEAIFLLVTGKSFRSAPDRELVPWQSENYQSSVIRAKITNANGTDNFLFSFTSSEKHIAVNGTSIRRLGELIGRLNAVLFTPADMELVSGTPGIRRRFLDIALCQVSSSYLHHLQRYSHALKQRNELLKQSSHRAEIAIELAPYTVQLSEHGAEIMLARAALLAEIREPAQMAYESISEKSEDLTIEYRPSMAIQHVHPLTVSSLTDTIMDNYGRNYESDLRRSITQHGPHRDDFDYQLNNRSARDFASQGQQRTCVVATRLSELYWIRSKTGQTPILLLDDLMGELDIYRREALLNALPEDGQIFITTTERETIENILQPATVHEMTHGKIVAQSH